MTDDNNNNKLDKDKLDKRAEEVLYGNKKEDWVPLDDLMEEDETNKEE